MAASPTRRILLFVGVRTAGSSILRLFPRWAAELGLDATIEGRDIPLGAPPGVHRDVVSGIAAREHVAGALVTTHKVAVFEHAGSLFDELDDFATLCREVSCISKRDGRLLGHAKDPITAGRALEHILTRGFWERPEAKVLCLGAGGAGRAITVHFLTQGLDPERIVVGDRDPGRVKALAQVCSRMGAPGVRVVLAEEARDAARLVAEVGAGSLVVNATGMGKDLPGSPLPDGAAFPHQGLVWDLNYRGDLAFLRQARSQQQERGLRIHDGWRYFLHGWTEVIAEVFDLRMTDEVFERLAALGEPLRPPA
jgi:shikimate dehydrogenase